MNDHNTVQWRRLRWACRRGMLELDEMLLPFYEKVGPSLSSQEQSIFQRLLESSDQDLYAWLIGSSQPSDQEFRVMIDMIGHYAKCADQGKS